MVVLRKSLAAPLPAVGFAACVILVLLAPVLLVTGQTVGAAVLLLLAFLVSPFGLPVVAGWLVDGLDWLRNAIRHRI